MSSRKLIVIILAFIAVISELNAQKFAFRVDDTDGIPPHVYAERRQRLIDSLPAHAIAVILSADIRNRQNDVDYEYRQSSDMLYLTGFPFPSSALLLSKDPMVIDGRTTHEAFFVRERNTSREQWQGVQAGPTEAEQVYGLTPSVTYGRLSSILDTLLGPPNDNANQSMQDDGASAGGNASKRQLFISGWATRSVPMPLLGKNLYVDTQHKNDLADKYGALTVVTPIPALIAMREVKDTAELRLLRKAVDITVGGHLAAIKGARPSMHEYEIEALMEYAFKRAGAEDVGYPSIVGSNYNACILHYTANRRASSTGDLILADCGAEYHGYTADVTRTFPINGRFTPEQRIIYNLVLEAQDSGIAACRAGAEFKAPHKAAYAVIQRGLVNLGIASDSSDVRSYFMHGTSHYLGLDVHDPGTRGPLQPNTVITVEPGIYIAEGSACDKKWWNIGVRIEDDILITTGLPENLSAALPRTAEAIEALMKHR